MKDKFRFAGVLLGSTQAFPRGEGAPPEFTRDKGADEGWRYLTGLPHQWLCFTWDNLHRCGERLHNWWGKRGKLLRYDAFFLKHNITTCNLLPSAHNMSPSLIRPSILRCAQVGPPSPRGKAWCAANSSSNRNLSYHPGTLVN